MLNFNTNTGKGVHLDNSEVPAFYIDPSDIQFVEKLHNLYKKMKEYMEKAKKQAKNVKVDLDENGVPEDATKFIDSLKDDYDFILENLDSLLGEGVTEKVFKGRYNQTLLAEFMEFIVKITKEERKGYVKKYAKKNSKGVM